MKRMLVAVVVGGWALTFVPAVLAQTADDIVEKHLAAMGGRAALAKITNEAASGAISIATAEVELQGTVEVYRKAPNLGHTRISLDLSALGGSSMVIDQICDGKTAVARNSLQGDREITGDQLQGMLNAGFPSGFLNYKDAGAKIDLVGKDKIGDKAVYVLNFAPKAGPASRIFLDAETYLIIKTVSKANIPEAGGEMEQTTEVSDYRTVNGVKAPFTIMSINAAQTVVMKLSKLEWNAAIDDALFSRGGK